MVRAAGRTCVALSPTTCVCTALQLRAFMHGVPSEVHSLNAVHDNDHGTISVQRAHCVFGLLHVSSCARGRRVLLKPGRHSNRASARCPHLWINPGWTKDVPASAQGTGRAPTYTPLVAWREGNQLLLCGKDNCSNQGWGNYSCEQGCMNAVSCCLATMPLLTVCTVLSQLERTASVVPYRRWPTSLAVDSMWSVWIPCRVACDPMWLAACCAGVSILLCPV